MLTPVLGEGDKSHCIRRNFWGGVPDNNRMKLSELSASRCPGQYYERPYHCHEACLHPHQHTRCRIRDGIMTPDALHITSSVLPQTDLNNKFQRALNICKVICPSAGKRPGFERILGPDSGSRAAAPHRRHLLNRARCMYGVSWGWLRLERPVWLSLDTDGHDRWVCLWVHFLCCLHKLANARHMSYAGIYLHMLDMLAYAIVLS